MTSVFWAALVKPFFALLLFGLPVAAIRSMRDGKFKRLMLTDVTRTKPRAWLVFIFVVSAFASLGFIVK